MRRLFSPAVSMILFLSQAGFAQKIFVARPSVGGEVKVTVEALQELIRSTVSELGHEPVANAKDSDLELQATLVPFGSAYLLSMEKRREGKSLFSTKLKGEKVEELDHLVKRVTRALLDNKIASEDVRISEISQAESTQGANRKPARIEQLISAGVVTLGNLSSSGLGFYLSGGKGWSWNDFGVGFTVEAAFDMKGAMLADAAFDGRYYFREGDTSPFAGFQFGFGVARSAGTRKMSGGLLAGGTLGCAFFRTYSVNLELGLHSTIIFLGSGGSSPNLTALKVGVIF